MSQRRHIPDTVDEKARELRKQRDFNSIGEAIRYMCREGGFDV